VLWEPERNEQKQNDKKAYKLGYSLTPKDFIKTVQHTMTTLPKMKLLPPPPLPPPTPLPPVVKRKADKDTNPQPQKKTKYEEELWFSSRL
jgi:hypothetical protein